MARAWRGRVASGVMNEISHGFLADLRSAIKETDPDALILGEEWGDASAWLLGTEADSAMNYRFRRGVIGLINGDTADPDGSIAGLTPSEFASHMAGVQEDYPPPAFAVLLNLVDSHDTTRILWTLAPGDDDPAIKEASPALDEAKRKLRLLATLQLTWPGMASIYYGDEVGLSGHDDPDDRRPYPWGAEDTALRDHYRALAHLRADHEALRSGSLRFLHADDEARTLAFLRRTDAEASVTVLNLSEDERALTIDVAGQLPDGTRLSDALGGGAAVVEESQLRLTLPPQTSAVLLTEPGVDLAPPAAPTGLAATAAPGSVHLVWQGVDGAAGYTVWRSLVPGGGYVAVGNSTGPQFTDRSPRNGTRYHYVVTTRDAAGNEGARSNEASALPALVVSDARLETRGTIEQPLSAVVPGPAVAATVRVDGVTSARGPTVGVRVEIGFGPAGSDPAADAGWTWSSAAFESDAGGADRFVASLRPEERGTYDVAVRVSTTGGTEWVYADEDGHANGYQREQAGELSAVPGPDTDPPPPPAAPVVSLISPSSLTLTWEPIDVPDLYRYEIWRGETDGGETDGRPSERVGTATGTAFTDDTVRTGREYVYAVTAQDTSFNRSPYSDLVAAAAEERQVVVTFTVTVPSYTPPGDTVYIAGDFQGWDPGATPMTRVDDVTWTISLPFAEGEPPQYKYTRGSWEAVEKDAGCGEIPNRTFTVTYGTDGTQSLNDTVGKWRDVDRCG